MEKEKYYTPNEDEFSSGFEYERYERSWLYDIKPIKNNLDGSIEAKVLSKPKQVADWIKRVYKLDDFCYIKDGELECWYNPEVLRVKYLDREDIESFGAVLKHEEPNNYNIMFYLKDVHSVIFNKINRRCVITVRCNIRQEDYTAFVGTIKNKSELSRLLKQLSII